MRQNRRPVAANQGCPLITVKLWVITAAMMMMIMVLLMIGEEHLFLRLSYFTTAVKAAITLISEERNEASESASHLILSLTSHVSCPSRVSLGPAGSLQIWYRLNREKEADVFTPPSGNLADGLLHRVQIHREGRDMYVQVSCFVWRDVYIYYIYYSTFFLIRSFSRLIEIPV